MADYTIISDVSNYIVTILRERMCPEPISSPNNIEVAAPTDQNQDYMLGLYLYDMQEEPGMSMPAYIQAGRVRLQKPPKPYGLYYMVFINGSAQTGLKAPDIQKILGRAAQIVADHNSVLPNQLQPWLDTQEPPIVLSQTQITLEEKMRVWQAVNKPYQVSLFYKAAPVFVSSEISVDTPRVVEASFSVNLTEGERGNQETWR